MSGGHSDKVGRSAERRRFSAARVSRDQGGRREGFLRQGFRREGEERASRSAAAEVGGLEKGFLRGRRRVLRFSFGEGFCVFEKCSSPESNALCNPFPLYSPPLFLCGIIKLAVPIIAA